MKPLHFLLAPDSFKGALSATQACAAMEIGIRRAVANRTNANSVDANRTNANCVDAICAAASTREVQITSVPLADGGEGTVEAFHCGAGGQLHEIMVRGPLDEVVEARWLLLPDKRAVIEMAQSSGLTLVAENRRDVLRASSYGLGETIKAALDFGCRELLIGVGGSATSDGGAGALQALGARFLDARGNELPSGGGALSQLSRIDLSQLDARLRETKIRVLCDVTNPLCGENGAARVFGPQKGSSPQDAQTLDAALFHFANVALGACASTRDATGESCDVKEDSQPTNAKRNVPRNPPEAHASTRTETQMQNDDTARATTAASTRDISLSDLRDISGAGAAGGAAFGLMRFCGAQLVSGIEAVLEVTRFFEKLESADLILTGEGSIDFQTPHGKALAGVARAAKSAKSGRGVPVVALAGRVKLSGAELQKMGIIAAFPIADGPLSLEESIARAAELLESATERAVSLWLGA